MGPKVANSDEYIAHHSAWQDILTTLRTLLRQTELQETIKWGAPVYTLGGKNVAAIAGFKHYAALWFYQGALLDDAAGVLINSQEGKTQALRQWRFTDLEDMEIALIEQYIAEAIENQRQGREVPLQPKPDVAVPAQLAMAFAENADLQEAFGQLAPYKQREYLEYIHTAKREATKQSRTKKVIPMIMDGRGLNDKYR